MEDFFVQECCVHGTDLEIHGPTSILCDDPLPIESNAQEWVKNQTDQNIMNANANIKGLYVMYR